jgi:hypothetical protein
MKLTFIKYMLFIYRVSNFLDSGQERLNVAHLSLTTIKVGILYRNVESMVLISPTPLFT